MADQTPINTQSQPSTKKLPVKGTGIRSMIRLVKKLGGEEGFQKLLERFPEDVRQRLSGTVLATDRFSEATNQTLINTIVDMFLEGKPERAVEIGKHIIDDGLNLVYKMFYKVGNPRWIISRGSLLWRQYHEVGSLEVFDMEANQVRTRLSFSHLDTAFCRVIMGCIIRALELSGARYIDVQHETCVGNGDENCTYLVKWL